MPRSSPNLGLFLLQKNNMDTQITQQLYELLATFERENEKLAEEIGKGCPKEYHAARTRISDEMQILPTLIENTIQAVDDAVRADAWDLPFYPCKGLITHVFNHVFERGHIENCLKKRAFKSPAQVILLSTSDIIVGEQFESHKKRRDKRVAYNTQMDKFYTTSANVVAYNDAFCNAFIYHAYMQTIKNPTSTIFKKLLQTAELICDLWIAQGTTKMKRA